MLTIRKSITINGNSKICTDDGTETIAVAMSASIPELGNVNITSTIVNQELYDSQKLQCRADIDEFTQKVREIEDTELGV